MTDVDSGSPSRGKLWLVACLTLLLGVVIYSDSLDPVVRTFGLAHAKIHRVDGSAAALVLDNLPTADAPSVQSVFPGEIWGRHAYGTLQTLLPFVVLAAALAGLSTLLASNISSSGSSFFHLRRGSTPPPVSLWAALFLGWCFAAWSVEGQQIHPSFALIPLVLAFGVNAALAASPLKDASSTARGFHWLAASRWFWLGYLTLSPEGLFRYEGLSDGSLPLRLAPLDLSACLLTLVILHWASRRPSALDLERFSGDTSRLRSEYERMSLLTIQELWLVVPAVLMAAVTSSLRLEHLAPYLMSSVACALLMKFAVERKGAGPAQIATRWCFRLTAVALVLAAPFVGPARVFFSSFHPPLAAWLILTCLAVVAGCPWLPANSASSSSSSASAVSDKSGRRARLDLSTALLGLAALAVTGVALRGGLPLPARDRALAAAQSELSESLGHQARLIRQNGQALLIGCDLDVARLSLAAEIVSNHLPGDETRVVSVRARRWERIGLIVLALTVALFLVVPTYLLTFASPGPSSWRYLSFCAVLAGINGAFAVGSALGWFWLDSMPHLAAFLLSTSLGWLGLGYARAWIDHRVSSLNSQSASPVSALGAARQQIR